MAEDDHSYPARFRLPRRMWDTYGRVLGDVDRSVDLLDHVRATIKERGDDHDLAELAAAEEELAERRSRKGGRPAKRLTAALDDVAAAASDTADAVQRLGNQIPQEG